MAKMTKTNKILIILSTFMLLFVVAILWIFYEKGAEPSTLITVVGGAVIAEILALCKLKLDKRKRQILKEIKEENDESS